MKTSLSIFMLLLVVMFLSSCNKSDSNDITGTGSGNQAPNAPSNPSPADGSTGVAQAFSLSWTCSDPDQGDTIRYDVYMGTSSPPSNLLSSNQLGTGYGTSIAPPNTTLYWKIVAKDNHGNYTDGPVWNFKTRN
jgi:hypothetical protein